MTKMGGALLLASRLLSQYLDKSPGGCHKVAYCVDNRGARKKTLRRGRGSPAGSVISDSGCGDDNQRAAVGLLIPSRDLPFRGSGEGVGGGRGVKGDSCALHYFSLGADCALVDVHRNDHAAAC